MLEPFGLYVILTDPVAGYERAAEAAVEAGVRLLQLRMKHALRDTVLLTAKALRVLTRGTGTLFVVNDFVDVAMDVDADGVHVGQEDMPLAEARRLWGTPGKLFGLSTHSEGQARAAEAQKPDYIGVGPVFATPTKERPDPTVGLERMGRIMRSTALPAVAIGGIDAGNLRDVLSQGAVDFAVVRAVNRSLRPEEEIARLQDIWRGYMGR